MKTAWLRSIIRRYGAPGLLFVGAYLLLHHIWHRKRAFLVGLALVLPIALATVHHVSPCKPVNFFLSVPPNSAAPDSDVEPTSFTLTDLGALPGSLYSIPAHINNTGQVVGYCPTEKQGVRAFLWQNGKLRNLGSLGGKSSLAFGINARGQVVGWSVSSAGVLRGFLWQNGRMQDLGALGGKFSFADAINNRGEVVGSAENKSEEFTAFLWHNGGMKPLAPFKNVDFSDAVSINDNGDAVGNLTQGWDSIHAFLYRNGKVSVLPTLGGDSSYAFAINRRGQVVGVSEIKPQTCNLVHAFVWEGGKPKDLSTLGGTDSLATDINDDGVAVGMARTSRMEFHACLWRRNGKIVDLNGLLPKRSDWLLIRATGINSRGQIIGIGAARGQYRGFLLTPSRSSASETLASSDDLSQHSSVALPPDTDIKVPDTEAILIHGMQTDLEICNDAQLRSPMFNTHTFGKIEQNEQIGPDLGGYIVYSPYNKLLDTLSASDMPLMLLYISTDAKTGVDTFRLRTDLRGTHELQETVREFR